MDDCVADWRAEILQTTLSPGIMVPDAHYQKIKDDHRFYRDLPVKEGGHDLVDYCSDLLARGEIQELSFLTALPKDNDVPFAVYDKVNWCNKHFPGIPMFIGPYSEDKWRYVLYPGDILIDDRWSNCSQWIEAGGLAHQYTHWDRSKAFLDGLFKDTL